MPPPPWQDAQPSGPHAGPGAGQEPQRPGPLDGPGPSDGPGPFDGPDPLDGPGLFDGLRGVERRLLPVALPHGLAMAGGHALRAHGFPACPGEGLAYATAAETPLAEAAEEAARTFRGTGLDATVTALTFLTARLHVTAPETGQGCDVDVLREALQQPPTRCGDLWVVGLEDAVGLVMRALHERCLARDLIDIASVAGLYSFRDLEHLARLHTEGFSPHELATRLEFADQIADEAFEAHGQAPERIVEIRRFAMSWVEDIKLRRADDGDTDYDDPDLPDID
ncbi:hypothetical protein ABT294_01340 [Nonomuraea sp. NPDC000554]|uniref:hypothetical protein n=1 Tax=Nonomuraea sp. NPDC000554 TaxID=3154259 RepID=UPI0033321DC9